LKGFLPIYTRRAGAVYAFSMRLSAHFVLHELTRSQLAVRHAIENRPDAHELANLHLLCEGFLEPLRADIGRPIHPSSGFRCRALNRLLGSRDSSQHCRGEAVDFEVLGLANVDLARHIASHMLFDQLILEYPQADAPYAGWIHVSYRENGNRRQVLTRLKNGFRRGLIVPERRESGRTGGNNRQ